MLVLPDVTLVVVETRCHELMRLSLADMVAKVQFGGGVIVHTDKPELIPLPIPVEYIAVPNWPTKVAQGGFYYMEAGHAAKTSHVLLMEWDAGLRNIECWSDEFLQYDYIGAPWVFSLGLRYRKHTVGNGGFLLMSKKLVDHIYEQRGAHKMHTDMEVAQSNRIRLENEIGAKWASEEVAIRFSYEHYGHAGHRIRALPSFGYHDIFNWPLALEREEVVKRTRLVMQNEYVVRNTSKLKLLSTAWPWVRQEVGAEAFDAAIRHHYPRQQNPLIRPRAFKRVGVKA